MQNIEREKQAKNITNYEIKMQQEIQKLQKMHKQKAKKNTSMQKHNKLLNKMQQGAQQ